jgi:pyruvate dehydrogenase E2 component (dihydrolipoamide acetyltransferase)
MAISVVMPALEMAQETGKLVSWLKKEGDSVTKGEPLLEIETDKAVMEIESPGDGILTGVKIAPGVEVPVGRTIAWILRPGESIPPEEGAQESARKMTSAPTSATISTNQVATAEQPKNESARISPKARRLANESGVNLSNVRGSGAGGEILASDILALAKSKAVVPSPAVKAASSISRLMAERTTESWTTVPHFFLTREVDAGPLVEMRLARNSSIDTSEGPKLTHSDLLVALVARTLTKHLALNSSWTAEGIRANAAINIGLAMAVEDGIVVPVIQNPDKITLDEITAQRHDLTARVRGVKLRPADLAGGTFTISNLGMFAVDEFTAIIIPPQAAILAVGAIVDRVVAVAGRPEVRPMMKLTLSSDHRVVDGARSAQFMTSLVEAIANCHTIL